MNKWEDTVLVSGSSVPYRVYEVLWCPGLRLSRRKLINVGFSVVEGNHPFNMIMISGTREKNFQKISREGCFGWISTEIMNYLSWNGV